MFYCHSYTLQELNFVFFVSFPFPRLSVNGTGLPRVFLAVTESWQSPTILGSRSQTGPWGNLGWNMYETPLKCLWCNWIGWVYWYIFKSQSMTSERKVPNVLRIFGSIYRPLYWLKTHPSVFDFLFVNLSLRARPQRSAQWSISISLLGLTMESHRAQKSWSSSEDWWDSTSREKELERQLWFTAGTERALVLFQVQSHL